MDPRFEENDWMFKTLLENENTQAGEHMAEAESRTGHPQPSMNEKALTRGRTDSCNNISPL